MMAKKRNYSLKDLQYRTKRFPLYMTLMEGDEIKKDEEVGWVELRGQSDPIYIKNTTAYLQKNAIYMGKDPDGETMKEGHGTAINLAVACAIVDWDEEFFGEPFTIEAAVELFRDERYWSIYNYLSNKLIEVEHFLPRATKQQLSGQN